MASGLGGRKEVLSTKAVELLQYMEKSIEKDEEEVEKERYRIWMQYLSLVYSQRPEGKEPANIKRAREEFVKAIKPKEKQEQIGPAKVYDWDFERLKRIQSQQKGG